jgi:hypothetical protein
VLGRQVRESSRLGGWGGKRFQRQDRHDLAKI